MNETWGSVVNNIESTLSFMHFFLGCFYIRKPFPVMICYGETKNTGPP
jgi:hypothetical protein